MGTLQKQTGAAKSPAQLARCQVCATRSVCFMSSVSQGTAQAMAGVIHERPFCKSDVLQIEGEVADHIAIIKLGMVKAVRKGLSDSERPVALLGRGQLIGAYGLLGQRNLIGGEALSAEGRLCVIDMAALYRLGVIDRVFLGYVYTMISNSVGHLADWAHLMRVKGLQQQLLGALRLMSNDHSNRMIRLPSHGTLAELLSTTRESVARSLRLLEQQGLLIRRDRWHCELIGPQAVDIAQLSFDPILTSPSFPDGRLSRTNLAHTRQD
jgi:CRP-like cAMP-binding protein